MNKQTLASCAVLTGLLFTTASSKGSDFKLKNRSTFSAAETARDPFWPIGWTPSATNDEQAPVILKAENFIVSSILLDPDSPLAVINGKEYGRGDMIPMKLASQTINVRVFAIQDGTVVLQYQDKSVSSTLQRK